jgi:hypothetical protein
VDRGCNVVVAVKNATFLKPLIFFRYKKQQYCLGNSGSVCSLRFVFAPNHELEEIEITTPLGNIIARSIIVEFLHFEMRTGQIIEAA